MIKFIKWILNLFIENKIENSNKKTENTIADHLPADEIFIKYEKFGNDPKPYAEGTLSFRNHFINFRSGSWGNGFAPKGKYIAEFFRNETGDAYSLFGVGFFVSLRPLFKTDRTDLGIHFDGGNGRDGKKGFVGTLGCIGLDADSLEEAMWVKKVFEMSFDSNQKYSVTII